MHTQQLPHLNNFEETDNHTVDPEDLVFRALVAEPSTTAILNFMYYSSRDSERPDEIASTGELGLYLRELRLKPAGPEIMSLEMKKNALWLVYYMKRQYESNVFSLAQIVDSIGEDYELYAVKILDVLVMLGLLILPAQETIVKYSMIVINPLAMSMISQCPSGEEFERMIETDAITIGMFDEIKRDTGLLRQSISA